MKIILLATLLVSLDCFSVEWKLSANAIIMRGNSELTQYGAGSEVKIKKFTGKISSELYSDKDNKFWMHEAFIEYEHALNEKWSLLSSAMVGKDSKKKIYFQSKELLSVAYRVFPWLKYSLGVGHKHNNGENYFLVSNHVGVAKEFNQMEIYSECWLHKWVHHYEVDLTFGSRYKVSERLKLGVSMNYDRSSDYPAGVKPWDLVNKLELVFSI